MKKNQKFLIALLIFILLAINYSFIDDLLIKNFGEFNSGVVERVIDGDTIIINGKSIRLLGINAPEKGEEYYEEAKNYLEYRILDRKVELVFGEERYDKYNRVLAYVFSEKQNINEELVKIGLANFYFPSGRDNYYENFLGAWKICIRDNKNLCEKSTHACGKCVEVFENKIKNTCAFSCDLINWTAKGEGREVFIFEEIIGFTQETFFDLDLNQEDTLFIRDSEGKLIFWKDQASLGNSLI